MPPESRGNRISVVRRPCELIDVAKLINSVGARSSQSRLPKERHERASSGHMQSAGLVLHAICADRISKACETLWAQPEARVAAVHHA